MNKCKASESKINMFGIFFGGNSPEDIEYDFSVKIQNSPRQEALARPPLNNYNGESVDEVAGKAAYDIFFLTVMAQDQLLSSREIQVRYDKFLAYLHDKRATNQSPQMPKSEVQLEFDF